MANGIREPEKIREQKMAAKNGRRESGNAGWQNIQHSTPKVEGGSRGVEKRKRKPKFEDEDEDEDEKMGWFAVLLRDAATTWKLAGGPPALRCRFRWRKGLKTG